MPDMPGAQMPPQQSPDTPGQGGPSAAPMLTPQPQEGKKQAGKVKMMVIAHALQLAAADFGVMSPDGSFALELLQKITKKYGKSEDDTKQLMPAELAQVFQQAAGPGAPPGGGAAPQPQQPPAAPPMAA